MLLTDLLNPLAWRLIHVDETGQLSALGELEKSSAVEAWRNLWQQRLVVAFAETYRIFIESYRYKMVTDDVVFNVVRVFAQPPLNFELYYYAFVKLRRVFCEHQPVFFV